MGVTMDFADWQGLTEPHKDVFRNRVRTIFSFAAPDVASREKAAHEFAKTERDELRTEVELLRADAPDRDALMNRMIKLLTDTANAIKGDPDPLAMHDWSDLPRVSTAMRAEVANLREIIDRMAGEHDGAAAERDAFKKALTWIKDNLGAVCEEFEICNHRSCDDSCSAWMVANEFLKGNYELPEE